MIGYLSGTIYQKGDDQVIVLVGGVGYLVFVASGTLAKVSVGEKAEFFTQTHIREDVFDLYGFIDREELRLFKLLTQIPGIGPKTALSVVDRGAEAVKRAVVGADVDFFTLIPRLGKKNAQKIIIELKSKLGNLTELSLAETGGQTAEVVEALAAMGYTKTEAASAVRRLPENLETVEERLRFALRQLSHPGPSSS